MLTVELCQLGCLPTKGGVSVRGSLTMGVFLGASVPGRRPPSPGGRIVAKNMLSAERKKIADKFSFFLCYFASPAKLYLGGFGYS